MERLGDERQMGSDDVVRDRVKHILLPKIVREVYSRGKRIDSEARSVA